jgi:hypothetical protein
MATVQSRQCPGCSGSGVEPCSACYGMGGRSENRVEYDWENNPQYREEWVSCFSCTGGMARCRRCAGSGVIAV